VAQDQVRTRLTRYLPLVGLAVAVPAIWVLIHLARKLDPHSILEALHAYSSTTVLLAITASMMALALNGVYEGLALREAGRPVGVLRPLFFAAIVYPIGHSVGLSTLSGGALRYRLYTPLGLSAGTIATLIFYTALAYVLALGTLLALTLVFEADRAAATLHLPVLAVMSLGLIGVGISVAYVLFTRFRRQPLALGRLRIPLPSFGFTLLQLAIGSVEIMCVALVLFLFMPAELSLSFWAFLGIYLLSILAGILSNVPAGLGVVEAAMLLMLRDLKPESLIAAMVAYRLAFEVLPLILAVALLALFEFGSRHGFAGRLWRKPSPSRSE
jgi:uncharacterized membrane protein YbhN (UPF0104 family)